MCHPETVLALGDGGAHYGMICDASYPTYLLSYWARDVAPARQVTLEWAVQALTASPAMALGMGDRGAVNVGKKADLNVIDHDKLRLGTLSVTRDLPGGGRRLRQRADGYTATVVNGVVTYREGEATGGLPGRLLRRGSTPG